MKKSIFHISDLHFVSNNAQSYGLVLSELLRDIRAKFASGHEDRYLLFSGDVVKEGRDAAAYNDFLSKYQPQLADLGFSKDRIICIPGNHDVSRDALEKELLSHEGLVTQCDSEATFLKYVRGKSIFSAKFANYLDFESRFAGMGVGEGALGQGYALSPELGIYCLNSAYFSSAGVNGPKGRIDDYGRLVVDTRGLQEWLQNTDFRTRVLLMHHPVSWLSDWMAREIKAVLGKNINILVTGHTHEQEAYAKCDGVGSHVHCMAPALFTSKDEPLGYSVITVSSKGPESVTYRQWIPKSRTFVSGTSLSNTDDGVLWFQKNEGQSRVSGEVGEVSKGASTPSIEAESRTELSLANLLRKRLDKALEVFSGQPTIFVEPIFSDYSEVSVGPGDKTKPTYSIDYIIERGFPAAIHAPPQFGLTCVARYFVCVAWEKTRRLWVYIDAAEVKPNKHAVSEALSNELNDLDATMADVYGVVVDSVRASEKDSAKLVKKFAEWYPGIDLLLMRSNDSPGEGDLSEVGGKVVRDSFLWSMPRAAIREIVSRYNDIRPLGDEDLVTSRLALDLEMMNIHRTPLNCFTLLKASEVQYEESPVNRAELIKRLLFVLFNGDQLPTYKSRPDVKDCEFILGYFCEQIIRDGQARFLRERFRGVLLKFCSDNLLDIDVEWVFDVLYRNNILVSRGHWFEFKFSYWVMYFAAQRMCQSVAFRDFIFEEKRYSSFPEIIEFYTGINRSMNDAVEILIRDLAGVIEEFDEKIALPKGFDIFSAAQWKPSSLALEQMREDASRGVGSSNLPDSVKDQYADRSYDASRPYAQDIKSALSGFSYNKMLQGMRAAAKALRNSDYVDTSLKKRLLAEIVSVWERAATVILVLVPALARNGEAAFDDVRYVLSGSFPDELEERLMAVLQEIPVNVSGYYENDLFSHKMGPLLAKELSGGMSNLARHLIALVLIKHRPRGWSAALKDYVSSLPRNSFYLLDCYKTLRIQYQYGYVSPGALSELEYLIKICAARHTTGAKELGRRKVELIAASLRDGDGEDLMPERKVGPDGELLESASLVEVDAEERL